ncbi:MAG: PEP-CTERM sorting domain-containing protein [Singulisphaera sp.]
MKTIRKRSFVVALLGTTGITMSLALTHNIAQAAVGIVAYSQNLNTTNYGPTGLNIGQDGFWFADCGADSAQTLQPVNTNNASSLPSWLSVDFTKGNTTYGFANAGNGAYGATGVAFADGGQAGYNNLTLPNGTTGLSGQLVDTLNATGSSSDTITSRWYFQPGAPSEEYISIVLDNTGTAAPPNGPTNVVRLRVSNFDHTGASVQATFDNLVSNGTADVYTFKLTGIDTVSGANGPGYFSVQLRTSGNSLGTADVGLAGIIFNPVPEPSTIALAAFAIASAAAAGVVRRRNRK